MHEHTLILNACMNMHIDCRLSCRFIKNVLVLLLYSEHVRKLLFKVTRVDVQPAPKVKKPPQRPRMPTAKLLSQVKKNVCGVCHKRIKKLSNAMVQCDMCGQWFHYKCVNISHKEAEEMDFTCPDSCTLV